MSLKTIELWLIAAENWNNKNATGKRTYESSCIIMQLIY